ncbi:SPOR domain-containing protein, partial [Microbispora sp. KK1-11]|uniref:SPOR domain-containing protein n=1 Tax=Microbispora sp. KK1-11 TaxID=2053005 RepID=UPI00115A9BA0
MDSGSPARADAQRRRSELSSRAGIAEGVGPVSVPRTAGSHKVVLATYSSYDAAQHAVDVLARH